MSAPNSLSAGAIAGIVVVAVLVAALAIWLLWRSLKKPKEIQEVEAGELDQLKVKEATTGPVPYDPRTYQVPVAAVADTKMAETPTVTSARRGSLYAPGGEYGSKATVASTAGPDATTTTTSTITSTPINVVNVAAAEAMAVASAPSVGISNPITATASEVTVKSVPDQLVPAIQAVPRRESKGVLASSLADKPLGADVSTVMVCNSQNSTNVP